MELTGDDQAPAQAGSRELSDGRLPVCTFPDRTRPRGPSAPDVDRLMTQLDVQCYLVPDGTRDRLNKSIMARLKAGISSGFRLETRFPSTTAS